MIYLRWTGVIEPGRETNVGWPIGGGGIGWNWPGGAGINPWFYTGYGYDGGW